MAHNPSQTETQVPSIIQVLARAMWPPALGYGIIADARLAWVAEILEELERAGYRIVPVEPTVAMCLAPAHEPASRYDEDVAIAYHSEIWRAMVEAAR